MQRLRDGRVIVAGQDKQKQEGMSINTAHFEEVRAIANDHGRRRTSIRCIGAWPGPLGRAVGLWSAVRGASSLRLRGPGL